MKICRLIKGIVYFISSIAFAYQFSLDDMLYGAFLGYGISNHDAYIALSTTTFVFNLSCVVYAIKGFYYLRTWQFADGLPRFEYKGKLRWGTTTGNSQNKYENIERVLQFRESLLGSRTNAEAAQEYARTSWVDGMLSRGGENTERTRAYIDSKLAGFTNFDGYEWLKQGGKDD
jgi:hypothetical protein